MVLLNCLWLFAWLRSLNRLSCQLYQVLLPRVFLDSSIYFSLSFHKASSLDILAINLMTHLSHIIMNWWLTLLSLSYVMLAISLSFTLLDPLKQFEIIFAEILNYGLESDLSVAFDRSLLNKCEFWKSFERFFWHG